MERFFQYFPSDGLHPGQRFQPTLPNAMNDTYEALSPAPEQHSVDLQQKGGILFRKRAKVKLVAAPQQKARLLRPEHTC
jgi:hypothetical protein